VWLLLFIGCVFIFELFSYRCALCTFFGRFLCVSLCVCVGASIGESVSGSVCVVASVFGDDLSFCLCISFCVFMCLCLRLIDFMLWRNADVRYLPAFPSQVLGWSLFSLLPCLLRPLRLFVLLSVCVCL